MRQRYFIPDCPFWRVNREWLSGLAVARALLLELAHPLIASGVADYSGFRQDPFGRLYRTMRVMTARDLHLRRVHFHFGAGSGGTAVLAIYPEQRMAFAMLANLGHAKFLFSRLMGVINPFLAAAHVNNS